MHCNEHVEACRVIYFLTPPRRTHCHAKKTIPTTFADRIFYRGTAIHSRCQPCDGEQTLLTYTPPSTAACTVQVSESATLSPLVHDVDPSLFPGANLDGRAGNLTNGLGEDLCCRRPPQRRCKGQQAVFPGAAGKYPALLSIICGPPSVTGQFMTVTLRWGIAIPTIHRSTLPGLETTVGLPSTGPTRARCTLTP